MASPKAGLRPGDRVWVVGGVPAGEINGLKKSLRRTGEAVPLIVNRGDRTLTIIYRAPKLKIDYPYLFLTFTGFLYLSIGLFTVFRRGRGESLLFFFMTLMSFIVYAYSPAGDIDLLYKALYLIEEFARILLPPLTLHFFLRFPRPLFRGRWAIPAIYAFPALLLLWEIDLLVLGNAYPSHRWPLSSIIVERWQVLHFAVYFTLAFVALAYTYRTASAAGQKRQIQWIFFGMGLGFLPFLFFYLIPFVLKGSETGYTSTGHPAARADPPRLRRINPRYKPVGRRGDHQGDPRVRGDIHLRHGGVLDHQPLSVPRDRRAVRRWSATSWPSPQDF